MHLLLYSSRSMYGDKASPLPDRTNEVTGTYADQCVALANELDLPSINLWSKMQETQGWQKKFLRFVNIRKCSGLKLLNLWKLLNSLNLWRSFAFHSDGLHLTPEGNAVVFQEVVKIFDGAGFSDLPYDFPPNSDIDGEHPERSFLQQCPAVWYHI